MNKPILSIITVNFNNNKGLLKTLESIKLQSFPSFEHIIIDGGSTDESKESIIQYQKSICYPLFWVSEPDKGIYDGMNKGITHANGEYLFFLNSGDCLTDNILMQIPFDGTQYIYGDVFVLNKRGVERKTYPSIPDLIFLSNNSLSHQTCFIHHSLFKNKRYDTKYKIISDWAHCFQCLIIERCSFLHLDYIISECDGNGISSNEIEVDRERALWLQENFPPILSKAFIDCAALDRAEFRSVVHILGNTRQFKKRMKKLILFLYKINNLFSRNK